MRKRAALLWRTRDDGGNVLLEFALVAPILLVLIVNILDFARLIWAQMQVEYSAQMGAQAAYKSCSTGIMPAKINCAALDNAVLTAIRSTSLGSAVALTSGYPTETYYCVSGTSLQSVGTYATPPSPFDCTDAGNSAAKPGDYIGVNVSYAFAPIFAGVSLASARTLSGNSIERLN